LIVKEELAHKKDPRSFFFLGEDAAAT